MNELYEKMLNILDEELLLALGCTEPIAFALAAAKCKEVLGEFPKEIFISASGNMIKNVQGVVIPNTNGLKGIVNATILGASAGKSSKSLKVLEDIDEKDIFKAKKLKNQTICTLSMKDTSAKLYVEVEMHNGDESAIVEIMHTHTNITKVIKNGQYVSYNPCSEIDFISPLTSRSELSISRIYDFVNNVDYLKLKKILDKQLKYNSAISEEGLRNDWGLCVGKTIQKSNYCNSLTSKMKAAAAAGSDARMSGCDLPVVINSGSGNQGMTIGVPISIYSKEKNIEEDKMYKALALANLIPIHIKTNIGRLSAFCGAVIAAIGVGSAIAYLEDGRLVTIENTIKNVVANLTGMICDGAKPSCALKIASSLDAAFLANKLAITGKVVDPNTGIIKEDIEETIQAMANIASDAMDKTDFMIIDIMSK